MFLTTKAKLMFQENKIMFHETNIAKILFPETSLAEVIFLEVNMAQIRDKYS